MALKRFKPYFSYLREVRFQFILGLVAGIIAAAASGAGLPFVIKFIVPFVTGNNPPEGFKLVLALSVIPLAFLFRAGGSFLNAYFMAYAGMYVLEQLRLQIFEKLQRLPLGFHNRNNTGDIMSRVTVDTQQLQGAIVAVVNSLVKEPATLISAIGVLTYLTIKHENTIFILIAIASVPGCVIPIRYIGKRILKKATREQEQAGTINHVLKENLAATREVRSYNLQKNEVDRFSAACRLFFKFTMKTIKYNKALSPLIELITSFAIVLTVYVAVKQDIEPSIIAAILTALYMCYEPIKKLGIVSATLKRAEASLDRLEYILHAEDTVPEAATPTPFDSVKGTIQFKHVSFQYDERIVLDNINIEIEAGQSVALVGPSGAGKSTFVNLVNRFYDVALGSVLIDGTDVRQVTKADLRSQIALVSQEAVLFGDTVANNIRIGKPNATLDEIKKAARHAHAHEFIEKLENGYETLVGECGSRFSGGQRQRISIARAFLKDAPVIILDEPTSALDAESEHRIQSALEGLSQGRTVLIIAHRFSTIQHADRILVFQEGRIIANGTHKELYSSNDLYQSLYDKQSKTTLEH